MNKTVASLMLVIALGLPAVAAPTIQMLNDSTPAYSAKILEDGFAGYVAGTILPTFCLEINEYFYPGKSYYAVLGTAAIKGGKDWNGGMYGNGPLVNVTSDPIDSRSAFLYTMFVNGDSRFTDQQKLQNAIHYIEAEITTRNSYVTIAETAVAVGGEWYGKGIGNVAVMTLWEKFDGCNYSGYAQDQMIMIQPNPGPNPVPTPGALILSSLGMVVVGYLRRRRSI